MSENLYVCYSPKGEKFELSRANYLDATEKFGFSKNPPAVAPDEPDEKEEDDDAASAEGADEQPEAPEVSGEAEAAEEPVSEEEVTEAPAKEELPYDAGDKNSVKSFLRSKGIEFDGRSSLDDLLKLAEGVEA